MIVTRANARNIITEAYGPDFQYRITTKTTIGVRPNSADMPVLCWRALIPGPLSAVRIGRLLPNLTIDWDFCITANATHN